MILHAARTDIGRMRRTNEDRIAVDAARGVLVVADGMGGHDGGEIASTLAVEAALAHLERAAAPPVGSQALQRILEDAVGAAHEAVRARNGNATGAAEMGTTLTIAQIAPQALSYAHAGDSRLYLLRRYGRLRQLTRDDTQARRLAEQGVAEDEITDRDRSSLLQAIGLAGPLQPQSGSSVLALGDTVILCSDGLSDLVSDEEIAGTVRRFDTDLDGAAQALVDAANAAGGRDNISVIVARGTDDVGQSSK